VWVERRLFPAPTVMPLEAAAEAVASVLAAQGYVDDIAIMPRMQDAAAELAARGEAPRTKAS
jgi:hypothetical protein